ncbi:hypothetical protein BT96DRAFT_979618 [Gymnopus androsaceus JB14]|uniref:F-box domain-containing protein n=1 Tax=Gymnopus androsaceus JB14 TaxID=1447944 RepID=A0A6A4H2F3_9AGAR|nr:hypothetical protein BT96DRAFT_979618 [Gymnopus androsaceus JB14]
MLCDQCLSERDSKDPIRRGATKPPHSPHAFQSELVTLQNSPAHAQKPYEFLLAPVTNLPTEILREIFGFFGSANQNEFISAFCIRHRVSLPGLFLMAVYARWRIHLASLCNGVLIEAGSAAPLDITFEVAGSSSARLDVLQILVAQAEWRHTLVCFARFSAQYQPPPQTSKTITSLQITVVSVGSDVDSFCDVDSFGFLVDSATFPAVTRLALTFTADYDWKPCNKLFQFNAQKLTEFFLRSSCSITSLHIESAILDDHDLIKVLVHTPKLQHFAFYQNDLHHKARLNTELQHYWVSPTMAFIQSLHGYKGIYSASKSGNALVPKLQHLSLRVFGDWFDDDQLFIDVVLSRSRWAPDPTLARDNGIEGLKSVELKILGRILDEKVYEPLTQLDGQGIRVEVFGEPEIVHT